MATRKSSPAQPPGGGALARSRQFAVSRGLPPPVIEGQDPIAPAKPKAPAADPAGKTKPPKTRGKP
jgi:hypothetical protein